MVETVTGRRSREAVFEPVLTVDIKSGEVTLDYRDRLWRDRMLNGTMPVQHPWTSLRGGQIVGPGDRKEDGWSEEIQHDD